MSRTVELPWPPRTLHPNGRPHWAALAKAKAKARGDAYLIARHLRVSEPVTVAVTLHPPSNRKRDLDGALSSLKASFDGIADAIGVDDSRWTWRLPSGFAEPVKGGKVCISIEQE
jgi:crossover junction endodeoxyribonuclease RusA